MYAIDGETCGLIWKQEVPNTLTINTINPSRSVLYLGSGATAEVVRVSSVSGSGPYTATLVRATLYDHPSGEALVVNAAPGDVLACSGIYTSDGGVAVSFKVNFTPSGSFQPLLDAAGAVTRGRFYLTGTVPASTTGIAFQPKMAAGTGVLSYGQVGVYNLTRMGALN